MAKNARAKYHSSKADLKTSVGRHAHFGGSEVLQQVLGQD